MIGKVPVPPFPRWTGVVATIGPLAPQRSEHADGRLSVSATVSVRLTRRARMWLRWRALTRRGGPGAAA